MRMLSPLFCWCLSTFYGSSWPPSLCQNLRLGSSNFHWIIILTAASSKLYQKCVYKHINACWYFALSTTSALMCVMLFAPTIHLKHCHSLSIILCWVFVVKNSYQQLHAKLNSILMLELLLLMLSFHHQLPYIAKYASLRIFGRAVHYAFPSTE